MLFARVSGLRDADLLTGSHQLVAQEAHGLASLLAHLTVIRQRRLFAAAGYSSMFDYCVRELGLSEDAASRRLAAAGLAAHHPALFDAIADRRLTLSTLLLLRTCVDAAPVDELITGLAHKTVAASREWLAGRFPQAALETRIEFIAEDGARTLADVGATSTSAGDIAMGLPAITRPAPSESLGSHEQLEPLQRSKTIPLNAEQVAYQFTVDRATHELFLRAQELLGRDVKPGDVAAVFARTLKAFVKQQEKARHGLHSETRGATRASATTRYIPARVKAEVHARDQGRCAFVTDDGVRCECRSDLEYDHVVPHAQGGRSTADNLRLLCPAHNQYEADRKLGRGFMELKRTGAKPLVNHAQDEEFPDARDVRSALVTLGYRKEEIGPAMEFAAALPPETKASDRVMAILKRRHVRGHGQTAAHRPVSP